MPAFAEHHLYSEHYLDCDEGYVHIGNRCVPAQSIVGDDHEVGGHHFRHAMEDMHMHYNEGGSDAEDDSGDDYPFADDPDDET